MHSKITRRKEGIERRGGGKKRWRSEDEEEDEEAKIKVHKITALIWKWNDGFVTYLAPVQRWTPDRVDWNTQKDIQTHA